MIRGRAALVAATLLVAGCGSGGTDVPDDVARELRGYVTDLRAAAAAGDRAAAARHLAELRQAVEAARAEGALSLVAGARILDAADAVDAELDLLPSPATSTTTTSPAPLPTTTSIPVTTTTDGGDDEGDDDDEDDD